MESDRRQEGVLSDATGGREVDEPHNVVHVKVAEWTAEDRLRAPVFMELRPEVDAATVISQVR